MSPVMVGPLVVLAALLVLPGRLPADRGIVVKAQQPMRSLVTRTAGVAQEAAERVVEVLMHDR